MKIIIAKLQGYSFHLLVAFILFFSATLYSSHSTRHLFESAARCGTLFHFTQSHYPSRCLQQSSLESSQPHTTKSVKPFLDNYIKLTPGQFMHLTEEQTKTQIEDTMNRIYLREQMAKNCAPQSIQDAAQNLYDVLVKQNDPPKKFFGPALSPRSALREFRHKQIKKNHLMVYKNQPLPENASARASSVGIEFKESFHENQQITPKQLYLLLHETCHRFRGDTEIHFQYPLHPIVFSNYYQPTKNSYECEYETENLTALTLAKTENWKILEVLINFRIQELIRNPEKKYLPYGLGALNGHSMAARQSKQLKNTALKIFEGMKHSYNCNCKQCFIVEEIKNYQPKNSYEESMTWFDEVLKKESAREKDEQL